MAQTDEFSEFEADEATFDAMLEQAEPAWLASREVGCRDDLFYGNEKE